MPVNLDNMLLTACKNGQKAIVQAFLKKGGFLLMDGDHFLHLTDLGREVAEDTYEKHLFFTEILVAAGVDPVTAERDACRIEHVVSKETFERLKATRKLSGKAVISSDES